MLFKVFKIVNPWTKKEEETGEVVSVNPESVSDLRGLAKRFNVQSVYAHGDDVSPDYLCGTNTYFSENDFEESETKYIFRPVNE